MSKMQVELPFSVGQTVYTAAWWNDKVIIFEDKILEIEFIVNENGVFVGNMICKNQFGANEYVTGNDFKHNPNIVKSHYSFKTRAGAEAKKKEMEERRK